MAPAAPPLQPNLISEDASATRRRTHFAALVVLVGIGAGLMGAALMGLLRAVQHAAWNYPAANFLAAVQQTPLRHLWLVLAGTGLLVAAARWLWRGPAGGHAGDVADAIWLGSARMPFLGTLARGAFSIIVVGLGAALGREGAPKQAGAALGSLLAHWGGLPLEQRRLLVACGAGAGIAAIYNVPLGGALFALEVLLGAVTMRYVVPAVTASSVATAVAWLFLHDRPTYEIPVHAVTVALFPGAVLTGAASGLLAALYIGLIAWADAHRPRRWLAYVAPVLVFLALALGASFYPQILGNGQNVVQLALNNQIALPLAAILFFLRPLATSACLGSGTPGGLFTPTIAVGALAGLLLGLGWKVFFPAEDPSAYALLGATAFLAATTKGPLSAIVLMLELTRHLDSLIVPAMIAVALAMVTCRRLDLRSIYTVKLHTRKGVARKPQR